MDDGRSEKRRELERILQQAAVLAAQLQHEEWPVGETPHYSQIETAANDVGQALSCEIQTAVSREVAAEHPPDTPCPDCGAVCRVDLEKREILTISGPTEITESVAKCRTCRRSFFPSARTLGA
jgi:hypothetical protein